MSRPRVVGPVQAVTQLEQVVRQEVDTGVSPGIVGGKVFADGRTQVVAYGDAGGGKRLDAGSVFEIGSITKLFTATLLADMTQRREVRLTDPVARLLPAGVSVPSRNGRQITLEELATHTSGLPVFPPPPSPGPGNPFANYTVGDLYKFLGAYKLTRDPGFRFEYSNVGVGLLGYALARRESKTYEELLRERILTPLHMTSTAITLTADMARHFAAGHDAGAVAAPLNLPPPLAPAGGLRSNITDMLRFASANLDRGPGALQRAMAAARAPRRRIDKDTRIGLNWMIESDKIAVHEGLTDGFASFIGIDATHHTAIVLLSNSTQPVGDIGRQLLRSPG